MWIYPIAVSLAVAVALTFERGYRLWISYAIDGRSFMAQIHKFILANDISGAIKHCSNTGDAALPRVIKAGLQRADLGEQQVQNAIDTASLEVIPKLDHRLPYLSLIANIATLFGLLGTISGLISAFAAVANADAQARQAILSAGISEAMNATAFGLITAIFTMIAHSVLAARSARLVEDLLRAWLEKPTHEHRRTTDLTMRSRRARAHLRRGLLRRLRGRRSRRLFRRDNGRGLLLRGRLSLRGWLW